MVKKTRSRAAAKNADAPTESTVDSVLGELEGLVEELEGGDLPLEQALKRFEHGVTLARQGSSMLDAVEQRVEILLAGSDDPVPFEAADESENDHA